MFWFLALAASQLCLAAEASSTHQVELGGTSYFLPPHETRRLEGWEDAEVPGADEFVPLTVVTLDGAPDADSVAAALQKYGEEDDVWSPAFTEGRFPGNKKASFGFGLLLNSALSPTRV